MEPETSDARGAYGLRIGGVSDAVRRQLGPVGPSWEPLELHARVAPAGAETAAGDPDRAHLRLPLVLGGEIVLQRTPLVAEVRRHERLPHDDELLHPYLAYVAGMVAWWHPRECVHGGAFVLDGGVWGVVGGRGSGKSSALGWLAREGHGIVSDDIVVIRDGCVLAGPRFVDLRAETAAALQAGTNIGKVGSRERWRLGVDPVPPELPLRGWIFLRWAPEIAVGHMSAGERLTALQANLALWGNPTNPAGLLELASLPAWELRRPRDWESIGRATDRLLAALS